MKASILAALLLTNYFSFAQKSLQIVRATAKKAVIVEGKDRFNWGINPSVKLDIHTISKILKPTWVKFNTDIDSIKVKIKPGEKFDFIVLLNNKDTCYTRLECPPMINYSAQKPVTHDTIPFSLTAYNNILINTIVNNLDTLPLIFDSGSEGLSLTNDALKQKMHPINADGKDHSLRIGNLTWNNLEIYPVELSGQGSSGRFGWDLFDGKLVEIDFDKNIFIVHSKLPKISKSYSKFDLEYRRGIFCIIGDLQIKDKRYSSPFLFDNGYQRTIMLDTVLMYEQQYPKDLQVIKKVIMHNGQGKEIPVITVNNEKLNLGNTALLNIPVQIMTGANPARFKAHILGNEVLKRFNTILDFQNYVAYLKPNSLINLPYKDAN